MGSLSFSQSIIEVEGTKGIFITEKHLDFINEIIVERDYFAKRVESKEVVIKNLQAIVLKQDILIALKQEQIEALSANVIDYKEIVVIEKQNTRKEKQKKVKAYITGGLIGVALGILVSFL